MIKHLKRLLILSQRLQHFVLWTYAVGTTCLVNVRRWALLILKVWFFLHLFCRMMILEPYILKLDFKILWMTFSSVDSLAILICCNAELKSKIHCLNRSPDRRSLSRNWIFRWAITPGLKECLLDFGFKEFVVGPPSIILEMAFGKWKQPSWTDIKNYVAGGQVRNGSVSDVSLDCLKYFHNIKRISFWKVCSTVFSVCFIACIMNSTAKWYSLDSRSTGRTYASALAEIYWISTRSSTSFIYFCCTFVSIIDPLRMVYQNYKGLRQNSLGIALRRVTEVWLLALITRLCQEVFDYLLFGSRWSLNWSFLGIFLVNFLVLVMTKSYTNDARNWRW